MFELMKKVIQIRQSIIFAATGGFCVISAFIIYTIEPETFPNPFVGFWWVMTTITTVGFGDYVPKTVAGQTFGIFLYISGIALIGVMIGKIVDAFSTYQTLKEEGKLDYKGKKHFVIIGWSSKTFKTIEELLLINKSDIVIIDTKQQAPCSHPRISYIQGDPTSRETLERANILYATSVCIFASDPIHNSVESDGRTLLIASAIERFANERNHPIYTIAEILNEKHIPNFKHANIDEYILSNEVFSDLMAQSAIYNGSTKLFMQLLHRKQGDDIWEIRKQLDWRVYDDAFCALKKRGATLIADHEDFSIVRRLQDPIPVDAKLYIICDETTYRKIIS
ncbi:potassium channel family protein [Alkalihalobacillus hemicellulosilyticus]|uniref:Potassium channel protein n=1 Tax=Halalkalibacter hemicellulosilyticusJCM 9152 TaxID=1236971 RepID=W4QE62_9BACI|nr:potassium channel family protein [Halalkalibacter hemicellulosilyticus]GAE30346.1 potassium channel protein [Halalkalibacter hemicellulosilyticusJCM 9152]